MLVDRTPSATYNWHMYEFLPIGYMLRGRYRILRVIGGGGMGVVYKSEDAEGSGALVAVKEMRIDIHSPGFTHNSPAASEVVRLRLRAARRAVLDVVRREAELLTD